jgi:hypothetical protein
LAVTSGANRVVLLTGRGEDGAQRSGQLVFESALVEQGAPAEYAALLTELLTTVLDGRNAVSQRWCRARAGPPARDFADYAERTAAEGAWDLRT